MLFFYGNEAARQHYLTDIEDGSGLKPIYNFLLKGHSSTYFATTFNPLILDL